MLLSYGGEVGARACLAAYAPLDILVERLVVEEQVGAVVARIEVTLQLTHRVQPRVQFVVAHQKVERGVQGDYQRCWRWRRDEMELTRCCCY